MLLTLFAHITSVHKSHTLQILSDFFYALASGQLSPFTYAVRTLYS